MGESCFVADFRRLKSKLRVYLIFAYVVYIDHRLLNGLVACPFDFVAAGNSTNMSQVQFRNLSRKSELFVFV